MNDYHRSLRQAGVALLALGLYDLAQMAYTIATRHGFFTSGGLFLLIPGALLLRGSLRMAWWVAFFAAAILGTALGYAAFLPTLVSPTILLPVLNSYPMAAGKWVLQLAITVWVFLKVTALPVRAASMRGRELPVKPFYGLIAGILVTAIGLGVLVAILRSEVGQRARVEAARQMGPGYRYLVLRVMWHYPKGNSARVIAYNSREASAFEVSWKE